MTYPYFKIALFQTPYCTQYKFYINKIDYVWKSLFWIPF